MRWVILPLALSLLRSWESGVWVEEFQQLQSSLCGFLQPLVELFVPPEETLQGFANDVLVRRAP